MYGALGHVWSTRACMEHKGMYGALGHVWSTRACMEH